MPDIARRLPAAAAAVLAPAPAPEPVCSSRAPRRGSRGAEGSRAAASSSSRRPTCRPCTATIESLAQSPRSEGCQAANRRAQTLMIFGLTRVCVVRWTCSPVRLPARMPPAGAASSCSSEHSHDTPTAQCVQWCKPSDQHCARAPRHLPCACSRLRRSRVRGVLALSGSWCKCRGCEGCKLRTTTRSLLPPPPPPPLARSASPLKAGGGRGSGGSGGGGSGSGSSGAGAVSGGGSNSGAGGTGGGSGPRQPDPETQRLLQV